MKQILKITILMMVFMVSINIFCHGNDNWPVLMGPYLGQKPPGMTPEIFAPGILNTDKTSSGCSIFPLNGKEFYTSYVTESSSGVARMRVVHGIWTKPEILHFSSTYSEDDICMSYDGNRLIFRSWRPLPDGTMPERSFLWFSDRRDKGWGPAQPLLCGGKPVRTGYPSVTKNNTLYFPFKKNNISGIYKSHLVNGAYQEPEFVYSRMEGKGSEGDMFMAPDESYMIIASSSFPECKVGNLSDLFVVFQRNDGSWTKPRSLGDEINTKYYENRSQVSHDGKYLFFYRYDPETKKENIYWVDAKIINGLKPTELK